MKQLTQKGLLGLLMLATVLMYQNCGSDSKTLSGSNSLEAESLDNGVVNQAPKLVCTFTKNGEASPYRVINTITGQDVLGANPRQGDIISINCSGTQDEDAINQLRFSYDADYQATAPAFTNISNNSFVFNATQVRDYPFAIRAIDSDGKITTKEFIVVVECNASAVAPSVAAANIQVRKASSGKANEFQYSVVGSINSGVAGNNSLRYAWDFNGDGVTDPVQSGTDAGRLDTTQAVQDNIYSIFTTTGTNTRKISLTVKNSCNKQTTVSADVQLDRAPHDLVGNMPAVEKPYYYIQGDITHAADRNNQRRNGEVLLTQYPDDVVRRIICDYDVGSNGKATFTMEAFNNYKLDTDNYKHGLNITVRNVDDTSSSSFVSSAAPNMSSSEYLVSEGGDSQVLENFEKASSSCQVAIRVRKAIGAVPCANGTSIQTEVAIILGEYSCANLTNLGSAGRESVRLDNGKFFCEVSIGDQCVGGGGGGGGEPPRQM